MAGVRETQVAIETILSPSTGKVRETQVAIETILMNTGGRVRVTQLTVETIAYRTPVGTARQPNVCVIC